MGSSQSKKWIPSHPRWAELVNAIEHGAVDDIKDLLNQAPELVKVNDLLYSSSLHRAAFFNQPEAIRLLVEKGADVNMGSRSYGAMGKAKEWDITPLMTACRIPCVDAANALLDCKAEVNLQSKHNRGQENSCSALSLLGAKKNTPHNAYNPPGNRWPPNATVEQKKALMDRMTASLPGK